MCRAIKEMLQDERTEGREEGRKEGRAEAIVDICREFGATRERTVQRLMEKCALDRESAEKMVG